ncbi:putative membrane protein [Candidatus Neoehrlichia lotoris str. RAC413]|uniref:Putative membrane protein n=1 Tax=Candidatus Neoehrlichia procyonis str. RAC413 TaxID=1359163 RepID=A0A0F3NM29_9RICK|nr:putative membrane protein [Candidatus Neoehrlichia lotoris str. RAC413]
MLVVIINFLLDMGYIVEMVYIVMYKDYYIFLYNDNNMANFY